MILPTSKDVVAHLHLLTLMLLFLLTLLFLSDADACGSDAGVLSSGSVPKEPLSFSP